MSDMDLLVDLHRGQRRQGPGSDSLTLLALSLASLPEHQELKIADIGCGTGASTLTLAKALRGSIIAVDFLPEFLCELETHAAANGVSNRIQTHCCDMTALPFEEEQLDLIWSEGAIYNMGFENGIGNWRKFLKPSGVLAISEITWLTRQRPVEVEEFWNHNYPQIDTASGKLEVLERQGFTPLGYFNLPVYCWLDNYYRPLEAVFNSFLDRHNHSQAAAELVEEHRREQALYEKYSDQYSYGFYIARKTA